MDLSPIEACKALGDAVRQLREQMGMSQETFAGKIDIQRNHMGAIERDETNPTWFTLLRVCDGLGLSVADIAAKGKRDWAGRTERRQSAGRALGSRARRRPRPRSRAHRWLAMRTRTIRRLAVAVLVVAGLGTVLWFGGWWIIDSYSDGQPDEPLAPVSVIRAEPRLVGSGARRGS